MLWGLIFNRDADQDKSRRSRGSFSDPWEFIARSSRSSDCSFGSVSEEGLSSVGLTPSLKDEGREEGSLSLPSFHESEEDLCFSSLHHGLVGTFYQLKNALVFTNEEENIVTNFRIVS